MKIINNLNSLNFKTKKNVDYLLEEFFKIDLFNPITDKNYFSQYDFSLFKNKKYRVHVFGMGGSSLKRKTFNAVFSSRKN